MSELTSAQRRVLELLRTYQARTGYMPTRAEIAREFGWKSANAAEDHLRALERKGFIEVVRAVQRGIRITEAGYKAMSARALLHPFSARPEAQFIALPVVNPSLVRDCALRGRAA